jgi:hypothetical protein
MAKGKKGVMPAALKAYWAKKLGVKTAAKKVVKKGK